MYSAKDLQVKIIDKPAADRVVKLHHYSGTVTRNSQVNFGVFLNGTLIGALQFGPSIDKRRTAPGLLVGMNEYLELNRLAIADVGIKNAESRTIAVCLRMLRKNYPHLKCILSYSDACQCGHGTIYQASGFRLLQISKNKSLYAIGDQVIAKKSVDNVMLPNGKYLSSYLMGKDVISDKTLNNTKMANGKSLISEFKKHGFQPLIGFQLKYVYYFDKALEARQTFIPFSEIPDDVKMIQGKRLVSRDNAASGFQSEEGGAIPTTGLHSEEENA